ncbi:unnamed protein product, partial [Effrenium voratum]
MSAPEDTQPDGPDGVSLSQETMQLGQDAPDAPDDVLKEPQPCKRPAAAKSSSLMKRPASQAAESSKPKAAKSAPKPKAAKSAPKPQAKVKGEPKPKPLGKKQKLAAVFAGEPASAAPADPSIPEEEVEIAEGAEESRDRSKAARFFQLMRGGSLPEAVLSEWQKSGTRKAQSALINNLFEKVGGRLQVKADFVRPATYQQTKTVERTETATDRQSGFGKTVFMRMYRFDTDDDLQAAIDAGDVMTFTTNGKTMYAVVNVELNTSAKKNNAETMASDVLELSAETGSIFDSIWSKLSPDVNDADSGASLAIKDADHKFGPDELQKVRPRLSVAINAMDKLLKETRKCASQITTKDDP